MLERPVVAGVPGRRLRVLRLQLPAHAPLRGGEPAGHQAHPRRPPPRDRPAGSRRRGRRPERVTTRDRGRSRVRGAENASFGIRLPDRRAPMGRAEGLTEGRVGCGDGGCGVHFSYPLMREIPRLDMKDSIPGGTPALRSSKDNSYLTLVRWQWKPTHHPQTKWVPATPRSRSLPDS